MNAVTLTKGERDLLWPALLERIASRAEMVEQDASHAQEGGQFQGDEHDALNGYVAALSCLGFNREADQQRFAVPEDAAGALADSLTAVADHAAAALKDHAKDGLTEGNEWFDLDTERRRVSLDVLARIEERHSLAGQR